jgi:hypothetical protein
MTAHYWDIPWLHLKLGDIVHRHDDERHHARIEAIHNSALARVTWLDTGWHSLEVLSELRKTEVGYP